MTEINDAYQAALELLPDSKMSGEIKRVYEEILKKRYEILF
jgi:hypothetical protein